MMSTVKTRRVSRTRRDGRTFSSEEVVFAQVARSLAAHKGLQANEVAFCSENGEVVKVKLASPLVATGTQYARPQDSPTFAPKVGRGDVIPKGELSIIGKQHLAQLLRPSDLPPEEVNGELLAVLYHGRPEEREYLLARITRVVRATAEKSLGGARSATAESKRARNALGKAEDKEASSSLVGGVAALGEEEEQEATERANDLLAVRDRASQTRLGKSLADNLVNVDLHDLAEEATGDVLAAIVEGELDQRRPFLAECKRIAYNAIRRYLRRTRWDTQYESCELGEESPSLWGEVQVAYEAEVRRPGERLADILQVLRRAFWKQAPKRRGQGKAQRERLARLETVVMLAFRGEEGNAYKEGPRGWEAKSRDLAFLRQVAEESPELKESIAVAV